MTREVVAALDAVTIAATYDRLAARPEEARAGSGRDRRPDWARRIERHVHRHEPVVELGCGRGVPVGWLLADRYRYIGVDCSRRMIEGAGEMLPKAAFTCADLTAVQFPAESLGAVVAFDVLVHVPRERHAGLVADIAKWLRPGGVVVGSLTATDTPLHIESEWCGVGPMQWSGFDPAGNRELLLAAGFDVIDELVDGPVAPYLPFGAHWFLARGPG